MDEDPITGRCLEGDPEAFEMLVNRYQSGVLSLAWGILKIREEAEDAAQEAFVRAFTNLREFDPTRPFRPWLYAIAVHGCLDRLKRRRLETRFREGLKGALLDQDSGAAAERRFENADLLVPLLDRLKPKERLSLYLSVVEGRTSAEVASILGCSEGSARVRIHNAKKKVRNWLKRNPHV
jgi:RNA polymerase sigma-70 factor (ECF subfamily)